MCQFLYCDLTCRKFLLAFLLKHLEVAFMFLMQTHDTHTPPPPSIANQLISIWCKREDCAQAQLIRAPLSLHRSLTPLIILMQTNKGFVCQRAVLSINNIRDLAAESIRSIIPLSVNSLLFYLISFHFFY